MFIRLRVERHIEVVAPQVSQGNLTTNISPLFRYELVTRQKKILWMNNTFIPLLPAPGHQHPAGHCNETRVRLYVLDQGRA